MNTIDQFKQLDALAREWRDFSREAYGWQTREYADYVRCYFAENGGHTSVTIGEYRSQVQIHFHSTTRFGDITLHSFTHLDSIISKATQLLAEERERVAQRTDAEVEAEKAGRIEQLEKQLAELKGVA